MNENLYNNFNISEVAILISSDCDGLGWLNGLDLQ